MGSKEVDVPFGAISLVLNIMFNQEDKEFLEVMNLRKHILSKMDKHPDEMFYAFSWVLLEGVKDGYLEFTKDLDLTAKDCEEIFKGMLEKEFNSLDDLDVAIDFGQKVLKKFDEVFRLLKKEKRGKERSL